MTARRYPEELPERAVRMVREHRKEYPSEWAAIRSLAEKVGTTPETLRLWVRRAEIDGGKRPGVTSEERERIRELERENRELRTARLKRPPSQLTRAAETCLALYLRLSK